MANRADQRRWQASCVSTIAGVCLLVSAAAVHAAHVVIYRWVDQGNHQVHFSDRAPTAADYEVVAVRAPPPPDPVAEQRLKALDEEVNRRS